MTYEAGEAVVDNSEPTRPDTAISTTAAALKMSADPAWDDQNGVDRYAAAEEVAWWPSYLASTLTGWTLNAINSCFCDKCKCHFSSSFSVLQHLRDSYKHLATVEALEAKGALYVHDCAQMIAPKYASECYQLDAYNQGQYNQSLIPSFQPGATLVDDGEKLTCEQLTSSTNRSTSPAQGVEPPSSDIFTASSEMSEQDNLKQQEQDQRQWRQRYKGKPQQGRYGDAVRAQKPQRQPMRAAPMPPPSTEKYEAAFPTLGGGMPAAPLRRWTPAAATRKLRVDAPEWAPGCPVTSFALLSVKARQTQPAQEAATPEKTADNGKAAESPRTSSDAAPEAASAVSASPQATGGRPKQEHKQKKQEQRQKQKTKEREAGSKEQGQQGGAAPTEGRSKQEDEKAAAPAPATPPAAPPAMSWRSVVARNTPIVPPAAPPAPVTAAAATAAPSAAPKQKDADAGREGRW